MSAPRFAYRFLRLRKSASQVAKPIRLPPTPLGLVEALAGVPPPGLRATTEKRNNHEKAEYAWYDNRCFAAVRYSLLSPCIGRQQRHRTCLVDGAQARDRTAPKAPFSVAGIHRTIEFPLNNAGGNRITVFVDTPIHGL